MSKAEDLVQPERLGKLKKCSDLIWAQAQDLPARSIVPQPTTLPRGPTPFTAGGKFMTLLTQYSLLGDEDKRPGYLHALQP
jgi:hypothetical protein